MKFKVEDFKFNEQGQMMAKFDEERGKYVLPIEALNYMSEEDRHYIEIYSKNRNMLLAMGKCQNDFVDAIFREGLEYSKSGQPITEEMIEQGKEMLKKNYSPSEVSLVNFGLTTGIYPYMEKPTTDTHPVLVVAAADEGRGEIEYDAYMITTASDTKDLFRRYDCPVRYWKEAGLDHASFIRTVMSRNFSEIIFTRQDCFGKLRPKDMKSFLEMNGYVERSRFTDPLAFLCWLVSNKIKDDGTDNDKLKIQSVEDIVESRQANCVDLAIVTYKMEVSDKDYKNPAIGWIRWRVSDHKTQGHLTSIFTYKSDMYTFEYLKPGFGTMRYLHYDDYKKALDGYGLLLKMNHPDKDVRRYSTKQQTRVFGKKELKKIINELDQFKSQKEFLESIWPYNQFLGESKYYSSTRQFITEMLMDLKR